jgi:hypothetical protein
MTVQGTNENRFKRIKSELLHKGRYGTYQLEDAMVMLNAEELLTTLAKAESAADCLAATLSIKAATDRALNQYAQLIAHNEQQITTRELIERQTEAGHGFDAYLA